MSRDFENELAQAGRDLDAAKVASKTAMDSVTLATVDHFRAWVPGYCKFRAMEAGRHATISDASLHAAKAAGADLEARAPAVVRQWFQADGLWADAEGATGITTSTVDNIPYGLHKALSYLFDQVDVILQGSNVKLPYYGKGASTIQSTFKEPGVISILQKYREYITKVAAVAKAAEQIAKIKREQVAADLEARWNKA